MNMVFHNIFAGLALLALGVPLLAQSAPTAVCSSPGTTSNISSPVNANISIWTLNVTSFRQDSSTIGGYTSKWNLSDLPAYVPKQKLNGTLSIWGSNYLKDGPLGGYWAAAFKNFQPGIEIKYTLPTTGIAVPALAAKVADLGVGRLATLTDLLTYEQVYGHDPVEISAATGSYDVYGWSPAFIIIVPKSNPIKQISMKQLDGIFGTARNGGYNRSTWLSHYPYKRGPEENIRTWGQLGLTGSWVNAPIRPCGQSQRANQQDIFQNLVLRGSDQWVEGYSSYANYATVNRTIASWSAQVKAAAEDPLSICIASPLTLGNTLKELPIQGFDGGPFVNRTLETVRNRTYPLINEIYFYANKEPGKAMDPKSYEFLRFILSREGQEEVQHEGRYAPLTASVVNAMRTRLEPNAS